MIPAIMALPIVGDVVGSVAGQVMDCIAPPPQSMTSTAPAASTSFAPYLNSAASATAPQTSAIGTPTGTMRASDWNQMGSSNALSWAKSLTGRHVDATDETGRTYSGIVSGVQQLGGVVALNVGGHLVSLTQLKQVSWSPSVV